MTTDASQVREVNSKLDPEIDDTREKKLDDSVNVTIAFDSLCVTSQYDVFGRLMSFLPISDSGRLTAMYLNVTAKIQVSLVDVEDTPLSPCSSFSSSSASSSSSSSSASYPHTSSQLPPVKCNESEESYVKMKKPREEEKKKMMKKLTLDVDSIDYQAVEIAIESVSGQADGLLTNTSECNCTEKTRNDGQRKSGLSRPSESCAHQLQHVKTKKNNKETRYLYASNSSESESDESIATFSRMLFWRLVLSLRLHMQQPLLQCIEKVM